MQEKEIIIKNLKTNYKIFGSGEHFLILHGWQSNSDRWQKVGELLSSKFTLVIPDLPGFGKSQEPLTAWSLDDYVEWLLAFSEKIPDLHNGFYLLGHSFGGALASKFAIKYNQKVEKLFLVSAACIRKNTAVKKLFYRISKIVKVFSFLPYYEQFRKAMYKFVVKKSDYPNLSGVMKDTYLRIISEDLSFKLPFLKVSTCIIWGDKDNLTPLSYAHVINKKIKDSKLIVIPGADHSLHRNVPEILAQKVLENI